MPLLPLDSTLRSSMSPAATRAAFRTLSARLLARRVESLGLRLQVVCAALALLMGAFTYWQVRVPLDGAVHNAARLHGAAAGVTAGVAFLGWRFGALLLGAALLAASRQTTLAARPAGPEWLALPLQPRELEWHFAREARLPALVVAVPALAAWLAGWGLLPPAVLAVFAVGFAALWFGSTRIASACALRAAATSARRLPGLPAMTRVLVHVRQQARDHGHRPARLVREPAWRALARLDRLVSLRAGSPRARLVLAGLFLALSLLVWGTRNREPLETRAEAFAAFAIACGWLGGWAAWRAAGDPASAVRPLPLGLADAWKARAIPMVIAIGAVLVLQSLTAVPLPPAARAGLLLAWLFPAVLVPLMGLHMGLSLAGSPTAAENLFYGWLGAGIVASLAIPLLGWGVLIGGFVHATRRLDRWNRPEVV